MDWICIKILKNKNKNKQIVLAYEQYYYLQLKKKKSNMIHYLWDLETDYYLSQ